MILRGFLLQYYGPATGAVPEVVLPAAIEDQSALAAWLGQKRGHRLALSTPRRGWKRKLLALARTNAEETLAKSLTELTSPANLQKALRDLAQALQLAAPPRRIEAYDVSNVQGTLATGSLVVFVNGQPAPAEYRKFHVLTEGAPDDVRMMREVLTRRFRHATGAEKAWPQPQFILLDGGKGQLNAGAAVLRAQKLPIPLAALAKKEEELFLPGRRTPVHLPRTSPALYLLQRIRDEAHRFSVGYHRLLRQKRMTRSLLDEIPGVGDATRRKLLRAFGSLRGVRTASPADLARVAGQTRAKTIRAFLDAG